MTPRLQILILHYLGDPRSWRTSMVEHELCLPSFAADHDYVVHDASLPLPDFVRDIDFDGIVLTQTFLGRRRHPGIFERVLREYAFVAASRACKIALPQDDYECSAVLDRWLADWRVDRIYTVCPQHWDVLYPLNNAAGKLRLGYTAYLSDTMIERWRSPRPFRTRTVDVSYRTVPMPAHIGRLGYDKWAIAERFRTAARGRDLVLDISVDPADAIVGAHWGAFLESSKFVLGANSGSSMYDPTGEISERAIDYQVHHPGASFAEIEAACFAGLDGRYEFTAISPRNLECGLIESAQILVRGQYSGVLEPQTHYIPMHADLSDAAEVFERMADVSSVQKMIARCKEALLSYPELRYRHHVAELLEAIAAGAPSGRAAARSTQQALFERYRAYKLRVEPTHWRKVRVKQRFQQTLVALGAQRVKRLLAGRRERVS
jgi:hypothetical protein